MPMEKLHVVKHGVGGDAGLTPSGWFAGVKVVRNFEEEYLAEFGRDSFVLADGKTEADYRDAFCGARRQLVLVACLDGQERCETLAEAERIRGPAAASGPQPALAWIELQDGAWRLMLWTPAGSNCLFESASPLRAPTAAQDAEQIYVASEGRGEDGPLVAIRDANGGLIAAVPGRQPRLAALDAGRVAVVVERVAGPTLTTLTVCLCERGQDPVELDLPQTGDYNFSADVVYDPDARLLSVVWESSPAWGYDERIGLHRELSLWELPDGADAFEPALGTANGRLPIQPRAYLDGTMHNFTPTNPRLVALGGEVAVAFRRFRFTGFKGFGWDTFVLRHDGDNWAELARVSENQGQPDAGYALVADDDGLLGFFPRCHQRRTRSFAEELADEPGTGRTWYCDKQCFEVWRFGRDEALPAIPMPAWKRAAYIVPPSMPEVAPPPVAYEPPGLQLIWADMHAHSAYSKCMSGNDGMPAEVLRFQRDVLGCTVLCLTEHVEYMSSPEFTRVLDTVEEEAGDDHIPLYGVEWSKFPAHHTNFFAIDREVFNRLRLLLLSCDHLTPIYARIKAELPSGSVVAIRHMHGKSSDEFGTNGRRVTETHDPEIEWAMEAMQTRGNMMMTPRPNQPLFPSNFLNRGARVGLVGGSDHSRGGGPNRFCLTGLWVAEPAARGVFDAIRARRTTAMSNGKVAIWAELNGTPMGESTRLSGAVRVQAHLSAATIMQRATLLRDGEALAWQDLGTARAEVELTDPAPPTGAHWYAVTVEAQSPCQRPPVMAHASPFFVEVG